MSIYFASEKNKRKRNEDSFCQMDIAMNHEASLGVFAVADGMGGLAEGKKYADRAIHLWYEKLIQVLLSQQFRDRSLADQMKALQDFSLNVYQFMNHTLYLEGLDLGIKGGTSFSAAIHFWDKWIISNCGDSPVYISKQGQVKLLSKIQNRAHHMMRNGLIQKGSEEFYRNKNRLMEYLGKREEVHPYVSMISDQEIEYLLMGTDGAFGDYDENSLGEILDQEHIPDSEIIASLFERVRAGGESDNQTAILYVKDRPWQEGEENKEARAQTDVRNCSYTVIEKKSVKRKFTSRLLRNKK